MRQTFRDFAVTAVATLTLAACTGDGRSAGGFAGPPTTPETRPAVALVAYDSCDAFLDEVQHLASRLLTIPAPIEPALGGTTSGVLERDGSPSGAASGVPEAAPGSTEAAPTEADRSADAGPAWRGTNLQEEGVDEPDVVKTDGGRLLTIAAGKLWSFALSAGLPAPAGSITLPQGGGMLLVDGDRALVLTTSYQPVPTDDPATRMIAPADVTTHLTLVDVSDPAAMEIAGTAELQGALVDARAVDGMVRVVTSSAPPRLDHVDRAAAGSSESLQRRTREAISRSDAQAWLPRYAVRDRDGGVVEQGPLVDCASVLAPPEPAGLGMVNVASVDLRADTLKPTGDTSILGAGEIVYASSSALYVTTTTWPDEQSGTVSRTAIHKLTIAGREPAAYVASGEVDGQLLDQFSLSELNGDLRVAATETVGVARPDDAPRSEQFPPAATTQSAVTVLRQVGAELRPIGRVDGLGRGEQIRSVRFLGHTGYVVTFRQTDPLYTIDLRDPTAPRVVGELKIPGYSSYLHPIGDGLLVGIGQDATPEGRTTGLQLSLFDVSDPAAPTQLQKLALPESWSEAEHEHHAFLWWPPESLAVVPVTNYGFGRPDGSFAPPFVGAIGFVIEREGIVERGRLTHPAPAWGARVPAAPGCEPGAGCATPLPAPSDPGIVSPSPGVDGTPIERAVVVDGVLLSFSEAGVKASDLGSFADLVWLPYP